MKKIIKVLLSIVFLFISYVGYKQYKKVHPPVDFSHIIPNDIDLQYHDKLKLIAYHNICFELESLAQSFWYENLIDISQENPKEPLALKERKRYLQKLHLLKNIESDLVKSTYFKKQGHSNFEIQRIEKIGIQQFLKDQQEKIFQERIHILGQKGDVSKFILLIQQKLNQLGYQIKEDGIFNSETEAALFKYQLSIHLEPTGLLDKYTYRKLVGNK